MRIKQTRDGAHREKFYWGIQDMRETECPVSQITQKSMDLIQIVSGMMSAQSATGSVVPLNQMPGHVSDAICIIRHESQAIEAAMEEALYQ